MAFTYTQTGVKDLGGCQLVHGTWDATDVTQGVIYLRLATAAGFPATYTTTTASNTTLTTSGDYTTAPIIQVGDVVSGTGIVSGTYVASIESGTSLTLSQAATDSTAAARVFTRPGVPARSVITANVVNSVSVATMTACRIRGNPSHGHLELTCVSGDAGWWSVWMS